MNEMTGHFKKVDQMNAELKSDLENAVQWID